MNNIEHDYLKLLHDVLHNGIEKDTRNGKTWSVFGRQIRHKMSAGFPLLTTKKMPFRLIATELMWFLRGDTNIKFLVDNDCHIWDGDAYKNYCKKVIRDKDIVHYLKSYSRDTNGVPTIEPYSKEEFIERIKNDDEFAKKWGELGPVYGKQWRRILMPFDMMVIDQIRNLINDLKTNPDSRRLMVNAWNVGELDHMVLPPCHYGFQIYTRELSLEERRSLVSQEMFNQIYNGGGPDTLSHSEINQWNVPTRSISLMWNQRSVDTFLGLPFNIASYGLLLEIIAKAVGMIPDELIGNLGDVHLYENHIEQARKQLTRQPYSLPKLVIDQFDETNHYVGDMDDISEYNIEQFRLEDYQSHPAIKAPLSN
jgi:thymidylate synthase